jgi:hypothetical protein
VKLYRVMKIDLDGKPLVGTKFGMLGVRPTDPSNKNPRRRPDVAAVSATDIVSPGEGLSTSLDPNVFKLRPGEAVFEIDTDDLGPDLRDNPDSPPHCLVQPIAPMTLESFQLAVADTRDLWEQVQ